MAQRPPTFDHLRSKEPVERTVVVPLSQSAVEAYEIAKSELGRRRMTMAAIGDETAVAGATQEAKALAAAEAELAKASVTMRFRCVGRKRWEQLIRAHPPTEEQRAENPDTAYNAETFAPAAIAASCVEPEMTEAEATELAETWNIAEFMQLWLAALEVNTQRRVVDLGKGSRRTHG